MGQELEDYKEELIKNVKEFSSLKNYRIKLIKKQGAGNVTSVKQSKSPKPSMFYTLGVSFGMFSGVAPLAMLTNAFSYGYNIALMGTVGGFLLISIYYYMLYNKLSEDLSEFSNYDFVIRSPMEDLAHELGHILLQKDGLEKNEENNGFIAGLDFFFNKNVKWDIEVEEFLKEYKLNRFGRLHGTALKYFDFVGSFYRLFRII